MAKASQMVTSKEMKVRFLPDPAFNVGLTSEQRGVRIRLQDTNLERIENIRCVSETLVYSEDMTNTQNRIDEAKEKAAQAWAKWEAAKQASKEAYFAFRNDTGTYEKYEKICEVRDDEYAEAIEAEEEVWRAESYDDWEKCADAKERAYKAAVR